MDYEPEPRTLREDAWKYFAFHADQRLRTFNFFLALVAVVGAALFAVLRDGTHLLVSEPLAGALLFFAIIFWLIDERNHDLLEGSEEALKYIEEGTGLPDEDGLPHRLKLFTREKAKTRLRIKKRKPVPYFTYRVSFRTVFAAVALSGLVLLIALPIAEVR